MGASPVRPQVLEFLQRNADQPLFTSAIADALNFTTKQVRNAVQNALRDDTANAAKHLEVLIRGNQYCWHSKPNNKTKSSDSPLFEQIKELNNGEILLQDEHGNLYVATALFE